jgi:hypothetical protein
MEGQRPDSDILASGSLRVPCIALASDRVHISRLVILHVLDLMTEKGKENVVEPTSLSIR